jgi:hypothetical protein
MKKKPNPLGTAENEFGSEKKLKRDLTPSVRLKIRSGAQNIKTGPDALGTAENESESAKHEKGPDALGTAETESGSAKREKGNRRPRYRRKQVREGKT